MQPTGGTCPPVRRTPAAPSNTTPQANGGSSGGNSPATPRSRRDGGTTGQHVRHATDRCPEADTGDAVSGKTTVTATLTANGGNGGDVSTTGGDREATAATVEPPRPARTPGTVSGGPAVLVASTGGNTAGAGSGGSSLDRPRRRFVGRPSTASNSGGDGGNAGNGGNGGNGCSTSLAASVAPVTAALVAQRRVALVAPRPRAPLTAVRPVVQVAPQTAVQAPAARPTPVTASGWRRRQRARMCGLWRNHLWCR